MTNSDTEIIRNQLLLALVARIFSFVLLACSIFLSHYECQLLFYVVKFFIYQV